MKPKRRDSHQPSLALRIRVLFGAEIILGPGKVELLRLVRETGSISEAARRMKMSYMRAWTLIQTMNRCCKTPVLSTARGGSKNGGAVLTNSGIRLIALYETMESECHTATRKTQFEIASLLSGKPGKS